MYLIIFVQLEMVYVKADSIIWGQASMFQFGAFMDIWFNRNQAWRLERNA